MIPRVHIYFITLHNKCLYNYSYPASTAHFNVNPTKKKKCQPYRKVLKLLVGFESWQCRLDHLCSTRLLKFDFRLFLPEKSPVESLTCVGEAAWNGSQLLSSALLPHGAKEMMYLIWTAGYSHLQLFIVCHEQIHIFVHAHTHTHTFQI